MTDVQILACHNCLGDIGFGVLDGFPHGIAFCQVGSNSGGEGAACSVQIIAFYLFLFIYMVYGFGSVKKVEHYVAFQVPAFY